VRWTLTVTPVSASTSLLTCKHHASRKHAVRSTQG
jgi:hypothetical protein